MQKIRALDPIFGQNEYAQIPTAVIGIVLKFFQIIMSIAIGMSAGWIPIVGFNLGAGRKDRVRELMRLLMLAEAAAGLVAAIILSFSLHSLSESSVQTMRAFTTRSSQ